MESNTNTTIPHCVIVATPNYNSFSYRRKNRRQGDSLASAGFLLMANGLIYGSILFSVPVNILRTYQTMFFVGAIFGSIAASVLLHKLQKSIHYYLAAVLTLISGISYVATKSDYVGVADGFIAANFFSGLAFGIVFLTSIIHGGGVCIKYLRGFFIFQLQSLITVGIFLNFIIQRIIFTENYPDPNSIPLAYGITLIVLSILSFISTILLCVESPEFLYETNNNSEALSTIKRLRKETMDSLEILNDSEEIQNSVCNKANFFESIMLKENLISFGKIFSLRLAYILGTSIPINLRFLLLLQLFLGTNTSALGYNGILFILLRILGEGIGSLSICKLKHKKPLIISLFLSGLLLIIINGIYIGLVEGEYKINNSTFDCLGALIFIYQFANGFASGGISLLAMSEGFEFNIKTYFNAIIIVFECLIQIIIICTFNLTDSVPTTAYIFITGIVQLFVSGLAFICIPETHHKSLKESSQLYSKLS